MVALGVPVVEMEEVDVELLGHRLEVAATPVCVVPQVREVVVEEIRVEVDAAPARLVVRRCRLVGHATDGHEFGAGERARDGSAGGRCGEQKARQHGERHPHEHEATLAHTSVDTSTTAVRD